MNKIMLGISLAALASAGAAIAQDHAPGMRMGMGADPMGDKTVTRAEVQAKAEEHFAKMDLNHDGKLDAADRAAHAGEMFDKLDANKDGTISRDEFAAAHRTGPDGGHDHGKQGSGKDGRGKDGRGKDGPGMGGAMMMLAMADTNHDGAVSKDEFVAAHLKMFDMADTNHDGQLTPAERMAARAKMREHMRHMGMGAAQGPGIDHADHDMAPPPPAPPGT